MQGMYSRGNHDYRGQHQLTAAQQDIHGSLESHKADELGIIDSLFGAPSSTDNMNAATDSLLAGLSGLGLSNDTSESIGDTAANIGGLWGPSSFSDWGGSGDPGMDAIGASLGDIISGTSSQQHYQKPKDNPF